MSEKYTGIVNVNEFFTNYYFGEVFKGDLTEETSRVRDLVGEKNEPFAAVRSLRGKYEAMYTNFTSKIFGAETLSDDFAAFAVEMLAALGYGAPVSDVKPLDLEASETLAVFHSVPREGTRPGMWFLLADPVAPTLAFADEDARDVLERHVFDYERDAADDAGMRSSEILEKVVAKIFYGDVPEPPRFLLVLSPETLLILDRQRWNDRKYLRVELKKLYDAREENAYRAVAAFAGKPSLMRADAPAAIDAFMEKSRLNATGVSQELKRSLRECVELIGNEVLYDYKTRLRREFGSEEGETERELTLQCLRYMYRLLFLFYIESRPELGYVPLNDPAYFSGYSLENLRDLADKTNSALAVRQEVSEGYFVQETLETLFEAIYYGYPALKTEYNNLRNEDSIKHVFLVPPLKAHIFDPERMPILNNAKLRNSCMLRVIKLMSIARHKGKGARGGRISYANLGVNQLGAVYESILSNTGFIAKEKLYEVHAATETPDDLGVGYFVPEAELDQYDEDTERRRNPDGTPFCYEAGTFVYRLSGREREKSASYYTPESLTQCLVKYALKELLKDKTADEILELTVCEPAMGSAAFLNETVNQLAEAYLSAKEKEIGPVPYAKRDEELQKVRMFIADRNIYGVDLNPVAVELAEVSLWLNTIYCGGRAPWFGTQLATGNSLVGARRQTYHVNKLRAEKTAKGKTKKTAKADLWYNYEPNELRIDFSDPKAKEIKEKTGEFYKNRDPSQVYHFLLGDPGMCAYEDKVIKALEPENYKRVKEWRKTFNEPFDDNAVATVLRLSASVDRLWKEQTRLRRVVEEKTRDPLSVYGHIEEEAGRLSSIREKDDVFYRLYKSEGVRNAGPYARLKFAMDYWCALWFWPIEKAELLPERDVFYNELSLILDGVVRFNVGKKDFHALQRSFDGMETETSRLAREIMESVSEQKEPGLDSIVDIDELCKKNPRLALVRGIAEKNRFLHWELEFADVFADRGGFDLFIGNPPWIKLSWNETSVLSDSAPGFVVKKLTATQTTKERENALAVPGVREAYLGEYCDITGQGAFLNAVQNYADLKGMLTNLYLCFLPQAWRFGSVLKVSAFVQPDTIYNDTNGGEFRQKLYKRVRRHFQFVNELKLFPEVHHCTIFSLNVYGESGEVAFDSIGNLFASSSIDDSYHADYDPTVPVEGVKTDEGLWNTHGHAHRIIRVTEQELAIFSKVFEDGANPKGTKLPVVHAQELVDVLRVFAGQKKKIGSIENIAAPSPLNETGAQKDGTIKPDVHFPTSGLDLIYSGSHIGVANPLFKTSRAICKLNSDFDNVDLTQIPDDYLQRCKYASALSDDEFVARLPDVKWGGKGNAFYKIVARNMLSLSGERTLVSAIAPKDSSFVNTIEPFIFKDSYSLVYVATLFNSLIFDAYTKLLGRGHFFFETGKVLPLGEREFASDLICRGLLLNCLNNYYNELWKEVLSDLSVNNSWSKSDPRLAPSRFNLSPEWTWDSPLRTDYERRQALVEIDVLTAMALGMTLEQLKTVYRIQFPVLRDYEADTWYDANGRIVFTNNRSLTGVGFSRKEWDAIKSAPAGEVFTRTITDDTLPGGPVERTIEYVAPFDRCDREQDYETAWAFFEERYADKRRRA